VPIRDPQGNVLKWYCTCTDVDDLKAAVEQRQESASRLGSILEAVDDAFVSLDDQLHITYFNAAAERMFGKKRDEVLQKEIFDAFPGGLDSLEEKLRGAVSARRMLSFQTRIGSKKDGKAFGVRVFPHAGGVSLFCQPVETAAGTKR
jgi:PAS domain S-box-containing protein